MPLVLVSGHAEDFAQGDDLPHPTLSHLVMPSLVKTTSMQELAAYLDAFCAVDEEANLWPHLMPFLPQLLDALVSPDVLKSDNEATATVSGLPSNATVLCSLAASTLPAAATQAQLHHDDDSRAQCLRDNWRLLRPRAMALVMAKWQHDVRLFLSSGGTLDDPGSDGTALQVHPNLRAFVHSVASAGGAAPSPVAGGTPTCHLCLENVVGTMELPCVLDLKLGRVRYHPCTPLAKREKIVAQEGRVQSTVFQCGVRICGAQHFYQTKDRSGANPPTSGVPSPLGCEMETLSKAYGHQCVCTTDALRQAVLTFLSPSRMVCDTCSTYSVDAPREGALCGTDPCAIAASSLLRHVHQRLSALHATLETHRALLRDVTCLASCSLLISYDAAIWGIAATCPTTGIDEFCRTAPERFRCQVHLIDLARCGRRDFNYSEDVIQFAESLKNLARLLDPAVGP